MHDRTPLIVESSLVLAAALFSLCVNIWRVQQSRRAGQPSPVFVRIAVVVLGIGVVLGIVLLGLQLTSH